MIYLDSGVFICGLLNEKPDPLAEGSISLLTKILKGEVQAATSFLSWDEVVWEVRKHLGNEAAISEGSKFLKFPKLAFISPDSAIMSLAQNLMQQYNLKPRDAIHAASALSKGIKEIVSEDPDFDGVKELKRKGIRKF